MGRLHLAQAPWEMARWSKRAKDARSYIFEQIDQIKDGTLRQNVREILLAGKYKLVDVIYGEQSGENPSPRDARALSKLSRSMPYDPTEAAPGAATDSHHCYPGGWAIHTALNLSATLNLATQAERLKGASVKRDAMIAAMVLHDCAKLKLLLWDENHALDTDQGFGHHRMAIAECIVRGFSPTVVELLAGVHGGWWLKPESVRRDIERTIDWVGLTNGGAEYIPKGDVLSVEGWIMRQAEISWYTATRNAAQKSREVIKNWTEQRSMDYTVERVQNAVFCRFDELELNQQLYAHGESSVYHMLDKWINDVI